MSDFLKEISKLQEQYNDIGKQIIKLYSDNWDSLIGRYFYHPYKETYIKITGFSKMLFGEEVLCYNYCEKSADTYDKYKIKYETKSDFFTKGGIPKGLVEITEDEFVEHMAKFFNEAAHHVMTYVKGDKKDE